jgi:hypothetical protein
VPFKMVVAYHLVVPMELAIHCLKSVNVPEELLVQHAWRLSVHALAIVTIEAFA